MWTATVCTYIALILWSSALFPMCICMFLCVLLSIQGVGHTRAACQCVEHLWHPCHPRSPSSALKQGNWNGGQAHRAVPKLSLFITATETGPGRQVAGPLVLTYCDHLLLHSVCLCEGVGVFENENESEETHNFCIRAGKCIFYIWPMNVSLSLWQIVALKQCACACTSLNGYAYIFTNVQKFCRQRNCWRECCCGTFLTERRAVLLSTEPLQVTISKKEKKNMVKVPFIPDYVNLHFPAKFY